MEYFLVEGNKKNNNMSTIKSYCCTTPNNIQCNEIDATKQTVSLDQVDVIRGFRVLCVDSVKKLTSLGQVTINNLYPSQINGSTKNAISLQSVDLGWGY